ncbi:MAG: type 1 glutamine amidotransferase domain-containing protein [Propionivibrio sp.]
MNSTLKILMILTSQSTMGVGGAPTGVWFEELTAPYYTFIDAGAEVEIASVAGGRIPIDPHSLKSAGSNPASVERFLNDAAAMRRMEHSTPLAALAAGDYDAVFLPGGHGTMWDLPHNAALANLLHSTWKNGKVIAAVCHGPAGLIGALDETGQPLVRGRRVSAFSNEEETAAGLSESVPFALESALRELGARYESGPAFRPFAVCDGRLVTGQNPASSEEVARLTLEAIRSAERSPLR